MQIGNLENKTLFKTNIPNVWSPYNNMRYGFYLTQLGVNFNCLFTFRRCSFEALKGLPLNTFLLFKDIGISGTHYHIFADLRESGKSIQEVAKAKLKGFQKIDKGVNYALANREVSSAISYFSKKVSRRHRQVFNEQESLSQVWEKIKLSDQQERFHLKINSKVHYPDEIRLPPELLSEIDLIDHRAYYDTILRLELIGYPFGRHFNSLKDYVLDFFDSMNYYFNGNVCTGIIFRYSDKVVVEAHLPRSTMLLLEYAKSIWYLMLGNRKKIIRNTKIKLLEVDSKYDFYKSKHGPKLYFYKRCTDALGRSSNDCAIELFIPKSETVSYTKDKSSKDRSKMAIKKMYKGAGVSTFGKPVVKKSGYVFEIDLGDFRTATKFCKYAKLELQASPNTKCIFMVKDKLLVGWTNDGLFMKEFFNIELENVKITFKRLKGEKLEDQLFILFLPVHPQLESKDQKFIIN